MIKKTFDALRTAYGPQHWWPTTEDGEVVPTYSGGPKTKKQQLEVVFGAILTQNTAWKNVEHALINLHQHGLVGLEKIKACDKNKLAELIRPSGYFNQKAERLKMMADFLLAHDLESFPLKEARKLLLKQKGIGPETADSILLYAFKKPVFVVDAYTKRIFSRIGIDGSNDYAAIQAKVHASFDAQHFNEFHALLVEHAKRYCKKMPICEECPLKAICAQNL